MKKIKKQSKILYLDTMRGLLMLMVVLYHSSLVFNTTPGWIVHSNQTTQVANFLVEFLYLFIMPLFFIISGYFALFKLDKVALNDFIIHRLKRLFIPLVSVSLTLNIIQSVIAKGENWATYYFQQAWVSHLWFLWNLIIYFVILYVILKYVRNKHKYIVDFISKINIYILMFLLPLFSILLLAIGKVFPKEVIGISTSDILYYLPYFFFGILLFVKKNILSEFTTMKTLVLITLFFITYMLYLSVITNSGIWYLVLGIYLKSLSGWFLLSLIFSFFINYMNFTSFFLSLLSNASYSIYLFHQVLVVAIASILIQYGIGNLYGLIVLFLSASIISIAIHVLLISKFKSLKLLYNGN